MTPETNSDFVTDRQMLIMGATQAIVVAALHPDSGAIVPDVLDLLDKVHGKITALIDGPTAEPVVSSEKVTAAQIRKSITPDGIVSFIDGKSYKTLRRHLTKHGLTPEGYRERYGLPADYPIVSAAYSAQRADLARAIGLGQMRQKTPEPAPEPNPAPKARRGKALETA